MEVDEGWRVHSVAIDGQALVGSLSPPGSDLEREQRVQSEGLRFMVQGSTSVDLDEVRQQVHAVATIHGLLDLIALRGGRIWKD